MLFRSQPDSRRKHKGSHQAMDVVALFRPITKWATHIAHPDNIPEVVRKAFKIATTEKPGACHIELAEDIAAMDAAVTFVAMIDTSSASCGSCDAAAACSCGTSPVTQPYIIHAEKSAKM